VALGQDFAGGGIVRKEFALAIDQRFRTYYDNDAFYTVPLWAEALGHSAILAEMVAEVPLLPDVRRLEIADGAAAEAAQGDYQELLRLGGDVSDFSPEGPLGPLWRAEQPSYLWWRLERPDRWVTPMARLGQPIWASERLSGDNVAYLVNFGLDRIESRPDLPDLIDRWTETAPQLVALASRPDAKIRKLVDCCRIDP
jgi:hypothetical protein